MLGKEALPVGIGVEPSACGPLVREQRCAPPIGLDPLPRRLPYAGPADPVSRWFLPPVFRQIGSHD